MSKSLKKVWNVVSSILVALVVILALLLVGARVAGLQVFTVLSGSMEPTYHTGSLIYVKKVDPSAIQEGQPSRLCWMKTPWPRTALWVLSPTRKTPP